MERIDRNTWQKHFGPRDRAALATVGAISLLIVVLLLALLF
jgi:type II secretory pathway component PulM